MKHRITDPTNYFADLNTDSNEMRIEGTWCEHNHKPSGDHPNQVVSVLNCFFP